MKLIGTHRLTSERTIYIIFVFLLMLSSSIVNNPYSFIDSSNFPKWICFLFCVGILLLIFSLDYRNNISSITNVEWGCIIYIFWAFFPFDGFQQNSLEALIFLSLIGFYFFLRTNDHSKAIDWATKSSIICVGICTLIIGLYQGIMKKEAITGTFDSVTGFSLTIVLTICILLYKLPPKKQWLGYGVFVLSLLILILVKSRVGCLSICITFIAMQGRKVAAFTIVGGIGIFLLLLNVKRESTIGRAFIYKTSISMLDTPKHILWGRGHNGFQKDYMLYQAKSLKDESEKIKILADDIKHPLNEFLLLLIEFGIIRCCFLIAIFFALCHQTQSDKLYSAILLNLLIFSLFSYPFTYPIAWIVLLWSVANIQKVKCSANLFHKRIFRIILFLFSGIILTRSYLHLTTRKEWENAYNAYCLGQRQETRTLYSHLYEKLHNQQYFLYNYASVLLHLQCEKKALPIIQECMITSYDTELLYGDIYAGLKKYGKALKHYQLASEMCPNRFTPLYAMFNVYGRLSDKEHQANCAAIILKKEIKIPSYEIELIKKNVKQEMEKK